MDWVLDKKDKYSMTEKDESNGKVIKKYDQYELTVVKTVHTHRRKEAEQQVLMPAQSLCGRNVAFYILFSKEVTTCIF